MPRYDTCPKCGGRKRSVSKTCQSCRYDLSSAPEQEPYSDVQHHLLDDDWLREFAGFFWGEGSAMILPNGSSYTAKISLTLRRDDLPLLQDVQRRLGGSLAWTGYKNKHRQVAWNVTGLERVKTVCELLLSASDLPAHKRGDMKLVLDFCDWRLPNLGCPLSDEDRTEMERRYQELQDYRDLDC